MLYATRSKNLDRLLLIVAADSLSDFETFANADHPSFADTDKDYALERADILDMLGDPDFKGYTLAPLKVECSNDAGVDAAISDLDLVILSQIEAVEKQAEMIEFARLAAEHDKPRDRRTLAEVHGLMENDPWDNSTEEQKEAAKKEDERMRAVREAGGLTGDSFAAKIGDKLTVHGTTVHIDKDGDVTGVDLKASKNTIKPYELTVDGEPVDWMEFFDELKLPENRVLSENGNTVVVQLHDFQTAEVAEILDRQHRSYTLTKQETIEALDEEETLTVDGHDDTHVFYSVQIDQGTVHEMIPLLGAEGFDTSLVLTMRNIGRGCWLAFKRETQANEAADLIRQKGHACAVVAINREGKAIVSGAANDQVRIVDTHEHVEIGPRPWNSRAAEIDAMSDEEKAELRKSVQASEYLIAIDESDRWKTVVYITPESYFRETGEMWTGELILDMLPDEKKAGVVLLTPIAPGQFKGGLEAQLMKDNMCRWGFIESLLFRIHLNDLLSEQRADV